MSVLAAAATATIQFVGIIMMVRDSATNPTNIHAVMPRLPFSAIVQTTTSRTPPAPNIERHIAFIAFREDAVVWDDWGRTKLTGKNAGYSRIDLNGEQVVFETPGTGNRFSTTAMTLPRLALSNGSQTLKPDFDGSYAGAAGVIYIPQGKLSSCHAVVDGVLETRVDTQLALTTQHYIVIRTVNGSKMLVLDATKFADNTSTLPPIYVANVPPQYAETYIAPMTGDAHWRAYYWMTTQPTGREPLLTNAQSNSVPPCVSNWRPMTSSGGLTGIHVASNGSMQQMVGSLGPLAPNLGPVGDPNPIVSVNTAECSNTQWP